MTYFFKQNYVFKEKYKLWMTMSLSSSPDEKGQNRIIFESMK